MRHIFLGNILVDANKQIPHSGRLQKYFRIPSHTNRCLECGEVKFTELISRYGVKRYSNVLFESDTAQIQSFPSKPLWLCALHKCFYIILILDRELKKVKKLLKTNILNTFIFLINWFIKPYKLAI